MQIDNVFYDVESDACAWLVSLGLEERLEDALLILFLNTDSVIGNNYLEMVFVGTCMAGQTHLVGGVFIGICQKVTNHLRHRLAVDDGRKLFVGELY